MLLDLNLLNKHGIRWRLKFNEDVDLTLQALSKKLYTLSINYIVASKPPTLGCKGGNTSIIYDQGNRFDEKYETLYNIWKGTVMEPFITNKIKHLDKRTHHLVKYSCITNIGWISALSISSSQRKQRACFKPQLEILF